MNIALLRAEMVKKGYTQRKLAGEMGITESTLSRKLKKNALRLMDAENISQILDIANPSEIFFS